MVMCEMNRMEGILGYNREGLERPIHVGIRVTISFPPQRSKEINHHA